MPYVSFISPFCILNIITQRKQGFSQNNNAKYGGILPTVDEKQNNLPVSFFKYPLCKITVIDSCQRNDVQVLPIFKNNKSKL